MLNAQNMSAVLGSRTLFSRSDIALGTGDLKLFIAPNGHGKTTLLTALAGSPARGVAGRVDADGVSPLSQEEFRRKVFYAPGDGSLLRGALPPLDLLGATHDLWRSNADVREVAAGFGATAFLHRPCFTLSKGMRQQVTLSLAFASGAPYVLLDEPLNALDPSNAARCARMIAEMTGRGRGVIVSSHIFDAIAPLVTSVLVIREGVVAELPAPGDSEGIANLYERTYGPRGARLGVHGRVAS